MAERAVRPGQVLYVRGGTTRRPLPFGLGDFLDGLSISVITLPCASTSALNTSFCRYQHLPPISVVSGISI